MDSLAPGILNNLALVADELGHSEEAFAWMAKYIALDTTEYSGYLNMGFMLATRERYPEALHYYGPAEKRGAFDGLFLNNRGYAKLMSGDTEGALEDIERSIKIVPSNSYAYRNRGLAYHRSGRNDEACTAFETALALGCTKPYGNDVKLAYDAYCH
jgi:tetratricopeptide (TPR) repeat protein